jgi:hypothetical protein
MPEFSKKTTKYVLAIYCVETVLIALQFCLEEEEEQLIRQDLPLFCQTIFKAPFHVDVFLCLDENTHVPLERWTLSLIESR